MKHIFWLSILGLVIAPAHAVVIQQVLVSPLGTDAGGEAIELLNDGEGEVNISGWRIATETSQQDAILPAGTILSTGKKYLVADAGWNASKDDTSWRAADHSEPLTLANSDAGIALYDSTDTLIDAVGWGNPAAIDEGLFEGMPVNAIEKGRALLRVQDTDNNSADFVSADPQFANDENMLLVASVTTQTVSIANVSITDDMPDEGIQWLPWPGTARTMEVRVTTDEPQQMHVEFAGVQYDMKSVNGSQYAPVTLHSSLAPAQYELRVVGQGSTVTMDVEVLGVAGLSVKTPVVHLSTDTTAVGRIANAGNLPIDIDLRATDLTNGNTSLFAESVLYSVDAQHYFSLSTQEQFVSIELLPEHEQEFSFALDAPLFTPAGTYTGQVVFVARP